jgi:hypothetical protein
MKPIPGKIDMLADLHRLTMMIKEKLFSSIEKLSTRYFFILNKMLQKITDVTEVDEIALQILKDNHHSLFLDSLVPLR